MLLRRKATIKDTDTGDKMDKETLAKLGGTVDWIEVPYNTSLSMTTEKDKWESAGRS